MDKKTIEAKLLGILAELKTLHYEAVRDCYDSEAQRTNQTFTEARNAVQKAYML